MLIIVQSIINIGSAVGILPIKGTTLPIISYGGSSKLATCTKIAVLLRIDFETKMRKIQAFKR
ncbi:FtsW/RodA/SpoVE family cell cycle protein [Candidatus Riesia pediculischaeffi]|uniref:Probable peptidoglycan glycosyltransferase FtsW n=1 Tax=Candidatus Riesia pediculischaeffi PTSU TaxID=1401651 RepID=A0A0C1S0U0_9ENTR|nr:Cell division protein FtsW [Candidatus Riesia pediculischaeffi PTSU]